MSLSVLTKLLGKRATGVYLLSIAIVSVLFGLGLDKVYELSGLSAQVTIGTATEIVPVWLKNGSAAVLLVLSIPILIRYLRRVFVRKVKGCGCSESTCAINSEEGQKTRKGHAVYDRTDDHLHTVDVPSTHKDCC
jgi:hypothetical protein